MTAGEIKGFTGVDDPYEEPSNAEVIVDTDNESIDLSLEKIIKKLETLGYLPIPDSISEKEEEKIRKRLEDLGYL